MRNNFFVPTPVTFLRVIKNALYHDTELSLAHYLSNYYRTFSALKWFIKKNQYFPTIRSVYFTSLNLSHCLETTMSFRLDLLSEAKMTKRRIPIACRRCLIFMNTDDRITYSCAIVTVKGYEREKTQTFQPLQTSSKAQNCNILP